MLGIHRMCFVELKFHLAFIISSLLLGTQNGEVRSAPRLSILEYHLVHLGENQAHMSMPVSQFSPCTPVWLRHVRLMP